MKKIKIATVLMLIAIAFSNCAKDGATGPAGANGATGVTGPTGPVLTGNLEGYVTIWDQYGGRVLTGQKGDTLTLVGTSTKVTTDSNGYYIFPNLTTGTYTIATTKAGCGNDFMQNIQFAGGGNATANDQISQIPTTVVPALLDSIGSTTQNITVYTTMTSTATQARAFILYIGTTASVSSSAANYLIYYTKNANANSTKLSFTIPEQDLTDAGFVSGQTVYFAAYGVGAKLTASSYVDYTNQGKTVFTALSTPAATLSLVFP